MTGLSQPVIPRRMGRPPIKRDIKVVKKTVWLHEQMIADVVALVGDQGFSGFTREAIQAELTRRERAARKAKPPAS